MKSIKQQKQYLLHLRAMECATKFRQLEAELVDLIQQIEAQKLFRDLGYSSLFAYVVEALKLSESQACNFINVARKSKEIPALKQAIQKGDLSISKARKIVPVLTRFNQKQWIEKAIELPQREIERAVANTIPGRLGRESLRPVSKDRLELRCGVTPELEKKLRRVQDLLSNKAKKAVSLEEAIETLVTEYLHRNDPVEKAQRHSQSVARQIEQLEQTEGPTKPTRSLPAALKHQLNSRDGGRCRHEDPGGKRCVQTRWLEFHHIKPFAEGGENSLSNLITLCSTHHKFLHPKSNARTTLSDI